MQKITFNGAGKKIDYESGSFLKGNNFHVCIKP